MAPERPILPKLTRRLTDNLARTLPAPEVGQVLYWCRDTPGLALRVTSGGARAYIAERRVDGKTVRRTLGKASGAAAISADAARKLQLDISGELQRGIDRLRVKEERRAEAKQEQVTLAAAVQNYVKAKRRRDGLALKASTAAEYLAMVRPGGTTKTGRPKRDGLLFPLANKSVHRISGKQIAELYRELEPRGQRRQAYAMQVLRAVLRYHGVHIPDNPLAPTTTPDKRIVLPAPRSNPRPIPPERVGAWWRAATVAGTTTADQLRFQLLTGCRPGEVTGIKVSDLDLVGGRVHLRDTKNRSDHTVLLSRQALDIAKARAKGKRAGTVLFDTTDVRKTLGTINRAAGVDSSVTPHKLRATFASIAQELVPVYTLKTMLNHASGTDITAAAYVRIGEPQLRAAWQSVADAIEAAPIGTQAA